MSCSKLEAISAPNYLNLSQLYSNYGFSCRKDLSFVVEVYLKSNREIEKILMRNQVRLTVKCCAAHLPHRRLISKGKGMQINM